MLHRLRSLFWVRAAPLFSSLALTSLSFLAVAPAAVAFTSVDAYFRAHPEELPYFLELQAQGQSAGAVTATVTGPSAGQIAADVASIGAGIAFPNAAGRLARISGYSPSEIQKGLQRLADRYCTQNPIDCYGVNAYYLRVSTPGWIGNNGINGYSSPDFFFTYSPGEDGFQPKPTDGWTIVKIIQKCYIFPEASATGFVNGVESFCVDLSTLTAIPRIGTPKTFGDLTPDQKRKALGLATPADFIPNPGGFDIPDDGTQLEPNGAPIFFPDPLSGDKLRPVSEPFPVTTSQAEVDEGAASGSENRSEASPRKEDITDGPHGPDRPIEDVVARAIKDKQSQGRWLSADAARAAVATLDVDKMEPRKPYSVPIPSGSGAVVRLYDEYPPTDTPQSKRYTVDPADRAVVIRTSTGIHIFPIGPEHEAYNKPAPIK